MYSQSFTITILMNDGSWHPVSGTYTTGSGQLYAITQQNGKPKAVACKLLDQASENATYREVSVYPPFE